MKKHLASMMVVIICSTAASFQAAAADMTGSFQLYEYVTVRWDGRDNTHLIRSNGRVEKLRELLLKAPRPEGIDDRTYYMTIAINAVAKEGYKVVGVTGDAIVMERPIGR